MEILRGCQNGVINISVSLNDERNGVILAHTQDGVCHFGLFPFAGSLCCENHLPRVTRKVVSPKWVTLRTWETFYPLMGKPFLETRAHLKIKVKDFQAFSFGV